MIAPSDLTFVVPGLQLMRRFVELVFDEGVATIGQALVEARSSLVFPGGSQPIVLSYQLLGDPLLRIFHASPVAAARGPDHGRTEISGGSGPGEAPSVLDDLAITPVASAPTSRPPAMEAWRHGSLALSRPVPIPALSSVRVECAIQGVRADGGFDAGILDLAGRAVRTLHPGAATTGVAVLEWDLRDERGQRVRPGIYFLRVSAGGESRTARVLVSAGP